MKKCSTIKIPPYLYYRVVCLNVFETLYKMFLKGYDAQDQVEVREG
jgi:hypothetical protein